jgi:RNA recognition motif-containing protein
VLHADVMLEPGSTRSKGCGLVTFASAHDAANAIQTLHDTDLKGRLIFVREDREGGRGGGGRSAVSAPADTSGCKIFVRNISKDMTWMELKDMFKEAGTVVRADVAQAPDGTGKGFGTVLLGSTRDVRRAHLRTPRHAAPRAQCRAMFPTRRLLAPDQPSDRRFSRHVCAVPSPPSRQAAKAIQLFHETEFNGRILEVRPDAHA